MTIKLEWKTEEQKFGSQVDVLRVGRIRVGTVDFALAAKSDPTQYNYRCSLPGLKESFLVGQRPTKEVARAQLEQVVLTWFRYCGVTSPSGSSHDEGGERGSGSSDGRTGRTESSPR